MGYKMKGFSGFGNSPMKKKIWPPTKGGVNVDELVDEDFQDLEGAQYSVDPHNVHAHKEEGSIKEQERNLEKYETKSKNK